MKVIEDLKCWDWVSNLKSLQMLPTHNNSALVFGTAMRSVEVTMKRRIPVFSISTVSIVLIMLLLPLALVCLAVDYENENFLGKNRPLMASQA